MSRIILHSDLNSFYASVEIAANPVLKNFPVAVCGNVEKRHGVVLARSEKAKKLGVKTGMTNWEAKSICPNIVLVSPHFNLYEDYSKKVRDIYLQYTDYVEPFGIDECWLDITGSIGIMGNALDIANDIRNRVKKELGVTVSIGVSYNKVFAKLGSDIKKPDAITVITPFNFKEKIWSLPASDLLFVGKSTYKQLLKYGVKTIGDIAKTSPDILYNLLGVAGKNLWEYANGLDNTEVKCITEYDAIKSIGRGMTAKKDLETNSSVYKLINYLSLQVGQNLYKNDLCACGVQISIKDNKFNTSQYQFILPEPTQSSFEIANSAYNYFCSHYNFDNPIRSITVRGINLQDVNNPIQQNIFADNTEILKKEKLQSTINKLQTDYGKDILCYATMINVQKDIL